MNFLPLFRKEFYSSKHRIVTLILMLAILPAFFAFTTVAFENTVPEDTPIALVPQSEETTPQDMDLVRGFVTGFSAPQDYEDFETAKTAMFRERVYAIIEVPPGLLDPDATSSMVVYIEGSNVPFDEPSQLAIDLIKATVEDNEQVQGEINIRREVVGPDFDINEYLIPILFMIVVLIFAFGYIPFDLSREKYVINRLEIESSLEKVIATKITVYMLFMLVSLLIFQVSVHYLDYGINVFSPLSTFSFIITFLYLSMVSVSLMVATEFKAVGRYVSVILLFIVIMFSALLFPRGLFSGIRRRVAEILPTHYSMVMARSGMMKEAPNALYTEYIIMSLLTTLGALVLLKLSIIYYRRKT